MADKRSIPRPVWLLGWVSLATDAASEAIYPILPFFLTRILGAGAVSLGIVEGAAEAANSVLKIVSGRVADRSRTKRPLVVGGYAVSSAVRPLTAVAGTWLHVFAVRLVDRMGKGIRSAPRDAILAGLATPDTRGRIFGFHRAMDHAGAVLGPLLASAFLFFYPGEYRALFALTIVPGAVAVALIFFVHEDAPATSPAPAVASTGAAGPPAGPAPRLPPQYTRFMLVLVLFTLGNSTDAFLLLKLTDAGASAAIVPLLWAALHVVKASLSMVGGVWSDRIGRQRVIALGWVVYAAVYAGFAATASLAGLIAWFLAYGLYFGLTEGTEKALVADLAPVSRRGLAFGIHTAVQGLGALAASVVFGLVWTAYGSAAAFGLGAALALSAAALLFLAVPQRPRERLV
jgi:MFS family permease